MSDDTQKTAESVKAQALSDYESEGLEIAARLLADEMLPNPCAVGDVYGFGEAIQALAEAHAKGRETAGKLAGARAMRDTTLELLDHHFGNIDACVTDAMQSGSGGASIVGASVKAQLEIMRRSLGIAPEGG